MSFQPRRIGISFLPPIIGREMLLAAIAYAAVGCGPSSPPVLSPEDESAKSAAHQQESKDMMEKGKPSRGAKGGHAGK